MSSAGAVDLVEALPLAHSASSPRSRAELPPEDGADVLLREVELVADAELALGVA